jgi:hypothetical protein
MTKTWKRILLGAGVAVGLLTAFVIEERIRGEWALRAWRERMRAAGERLTLAEIRPPIPPRPGVRVLSPNQAVTALATVAPPQHVPPAMTLVAPGRARRVSQADSWREGDQLISWTNVAPAILAGREALAVLRADLTNQALFVKLDYDEGFELLLPHLAKQKVVAQALSADALLALRAGDLAVATEDLVCFPALVAFCQQDRLLIGDLVAIAVGAIGAAATWEALQCEGWTDDQLAALQRAWQSVRYVESLARALELERAFGGLYFDRSRYSLGAVLRMAAPMGFAPSPHWDTSDGIWWAEWLEPVAELGVRARWWAGAAMWGVAWREQDQLRHHQILQRWIEEARQAATNRFFSVSPTGDGELELPLIGDLDPRHPFAMRYWLSQMLVPSLSRATQKAAVTEAFNELLVTACALHRYRLRHGCWPNTLNELTPEFLAEPPRDWFAGRPLRYAPREDGTFQLYSVGADGRDDGGDARPIGKDTVLAVQRGRDLVWPVAATEEEVAAWAGQRRGKSAGRLGN